MLGTNGQGDPAARREFRGHDRFTRRACAHEIIENPVRDRLVESALVAIGSEVELQRLALDAKRIGDVFDGDLREIHLAGDRAERGEIRGLKSNAVLSPRWIWKRLEPCFRWGEEGNRASLLPSNVNPAVFFRFVTSTNYGSPARDSISFQCGSDLSVATGRNELRAESRGTEAPPTLAFLIRLPQHWIRQGALAIAGLVVVPVIDFQIALHLQMAAVGRGPFAKQMRAIAIENEMVDASRVLDGNVDCFLGRLE